VADSRQFTLIGEFQDNITGPLGKINDSIASLKRNLGGFGGKKGSFSDLTQSMGKVINAHIKLNEQVRDLRSELTKSLPVLKEYRREVGKAVSANMHLGGKKFNKNNNPHLQFLDEATRRTRELAAESRRVNLGTRTPRRMGGGGGGGGRSMPSPSRTMAPRSGGGGGYGGGRGGGGRGGGPGGFHMAEFGFAYTLGEGISQPLQNAIIKGFQIGVGFMTKPFEYFAKNLQERIQDEQSDIKAAGGIFSIARRQKDPFVKTMDEAMEFTQTNNKYMAELAAALPGNTQQYIDVSKRISDSISRIVMSDPKKAIEYSNKLREEEGKQDLSGSTQAQTKGAITQLLGEMTKKTVLAGLGTGGGPGGVAGAYGLPQLTERMLTQDQVSMGQFQRYAAIFKDPLIMDALNRFIPKINASAAGTMDRFEVMQKFYDEVLPKEMIRKFERSTAGILELFNTTIFGPETGLFGLGRKMEGMGKVMDDYGNYVKVFEDGTRKVVQTFDEASNANLSLFDLLRDSFANLGIALYPILESLSLIFDPLNKVSKLLVDFRHLSGEFLNSFESYKKGFEDLVKGMDKGAKAEFLKIGVDLRASLAAVNNFFANAGIINEGQFQANAKQLMSSSFDVKAMMGGMLDTFLNSKKAGELGELIGTIIGTVFSEVSKVTGFLSGRIAGSNKLFEGIKSAFEKAGGPKAITNIFKDVFGSIVKLLHEVGKLIPFEGYMLAALAVVLPAAVQGIGMAIAQGITGMMGMGRNAVLKQFGMAGNGQNGVGAARELYKLDKAKARITGGASPLTRTGAPKSAAFRAIKASRITNPQFPGVGLGMTPGVGGVTGPFRAPKIPKGPKITPPKGFKVQITSIAKNALPATGNFLKGVQGRMGAGGLTGLKNPIGMLGKFGGALAVVTGILSGIGRLLSGGSIFEGLGAAAGPIIGTIIGTAILGPLGGFIGGWIGSQQAVGDKLGEVFQQLGDSIAGVTSALAAMGSDFLLFVQSLTGATTEAQAFSQILAAINVILFPLNAALDLLNVGANLLRIAFLEVIMFVDQWFQGGKNQAELNKRYEEANKSLVRLIAANDEKYAKISRLKGDKAVLGGKQVTWDGTQWTGADGKPATPKPGAPAAAQAPAANPAAVAAQAQAVTATSTNTQQLNQKAATQVAHAAGTRNAAVKTQTNTTTANTTLGNIRVGIIAVSNKLSSLQSAILGDLNNIEAGVTRISSLLASGGLKVKTDTPFFPGAHGIPMGGASGSLGAAQSLASQNGLGLTSYFRAGDKGMHGVGRAMDFSNGVNTPQQMAFAQQMISRYGSSLAELIYTPLGFGIKNGQKVPLSYWGERTNAMHYNHVHVAFAKGKEDGKMFSSKSAAGGWENSMVPGSVKIASVTANSGDGGGFGAMTVNNSITINQLPGQSTDELASIVAIKIGEAVADARAASIFV
jgi:hypothetical protein